MGPNNFDMGKMFSGNLKGKYKFKMNYEYKDQEIKSEMSEIFEKINNVADTVFEHLKKIDREHNIVKSIELSPEDI